MMWRIMQIEEEHAIDWLHRPPNMVTMCQLWGFSGGTDNQKRGNIEQIILNLTPLLLNHLGEKGLTTKWFILVGPFNYVAPRYYSPCATNLQCPYWFLIVKLLYLSKKWTKNPLIDDAQSFKLATDHETIRSFHGSLCGRCRKVLVPLLFSCSKRLGN